MRNKVAEQFRKPHGFLGNIIGLIMKIGNLPDNIKLIARFDICDTDKVLEIGFGNGDAIKLIAKKNSLCKISGIDFSELMCARAGRMNRALIRSGRLSLIYGDFLHHDFKDSRFTKIYCINVIYFWDDLKQAISKVIDLLEPGSLFGIFMVSAGDLQQHQNTKSDVFNKYTVDHVRSIMESAGFKDIRIFEESGNNRKAYCIYAGKQDQRI